MIGVLVSENTINDKNEPTKGISYARPEEISIERVFAKGVILPGKMDPFSLTLMGFERNNEK